MSERIATQTNGRLRIRVYHAGQLGRESDTVDLARFGALDITRVNFAPLNNAFPATRVFSLPYVFESVEHMRRAADGKPGAAVLEQFASRELVGLAIYDAGSRSFYNVRRPINEPRDLHGLKVRVPPSDIFIATIAALGGNPTPLPFGEVYSAMQTHLIEGAENNWRTFHTSRQFEVAHYWSQSDHSYSPEALLMSRRTYDALTARDREIVVEAARESVPYMRTLWDKMEAESRAFVLAAGVQANDVDLPAFRKVAASIQERYLADRSLRQIFDGIRGLA
jgi:tripartite ATP-independent transporter DctP family solute receptor